MQLEFNINQIKELEQYFQLKWEVVSRLPDAKNAGGDKIYYLEKGNQYTEYRLIKGIWCTGQTFTKGS